MIGLQMQYLPIRKMQLSLSAWTNKDGLFNVEPIKTDVAKFMKSPSIEQNNLYH